jgi:hypothetical protein
MRTQVQEQDGIGDVPSHAATNSDCLNRITKEIPMLRKFINAGVAVVFGGATILQAAGPGAVALAANDTTALTDFSAQKPPQKGPPPKAVVVPRVAPRVVPVAPRVAPRVAPVAPRVVNPQFAPRVAPANPQFAPRVAPVAPRVVPGVAPRIVTPAPRFVPRISPGARGASFVGGRQFFVNRGVYRRNYGGRFVTFVGIGAVAAILVGATYYRPYGYVEIEPPACTGVTEEGCELRLTDVPTEEGEVVPQCVQFCPPAEAPVEPPPPQ